MTHHLAQLNIARMVAPLEDPRMREFVDALEPVNALADASPGFVWRLQDEAGDATSIRAFEDPTLLVNMSVWADADALKRFVYKSAHADVLRQRRKWFLPLEGPHSVLWWVRSGHLPSLEEAKLRLGLLTTHGATQRAFTLARCFPPPDRDAVSLRAGVPADAERLTEVAHAAKRHWGYPESWVASWRRALTVTPSYVRDHPVFVAERAGELVGFVALDVAVGRAEVDHLWVRPAHLGQGLGRRLMRRAVQHCRAAGVSRLRVVADPNAADFYVKMGATPVGFEPSTPAPRRLPVLYFDLQRVLPRLD